MHKMTKVFVLLNKKINLVFSDETGRLLTDVPIVNYFGWGLVAGFINYFVQ